MPNTIRAIHAAARALGITPRVLVHGNEHCVYVARLTTAQVGALEQALEPLADRDTSIRVHCRNVLDPEILPRWLNWWWLDI